MRVLADEVDFQALTPGRHWQATTVQRRPGDHPAGGSATGTTSYELCSLATGRVRNASTSPTGCGCAGATDYLVEQQAYYRAER